MIAPGSRDPLSLEPVDASNEVLAQAATRKLPRWTRPTFGGLYFWSDVAARNGWRVQRHAHYQGRFRLLDPRNWLRAEGSRALIERTLDRLAPPLEGVAQRTAVVLLHGLLTTRYTMARLAWAMRTEGHDVYNLSYPTNLLSIDEHGANLAGVLESLADYGRVHLVGFSMGGLVIRSALAQQQFANLGRCVMIGTPNQGAEKADMWHRWTSLAKFAGQAGRQLGTGDEGIHRRLPPSIDLETGIIAGGRGRKTGYHPLLSGDNDFTVTVDSTKLPSAKDFLLLPCIHGLLPSHGTAVRETVHFLREGVFSTSVRTPVAVG